MLKLLWSFTVLCFLALRTSAEEDYASSCRPVLSKLTYGEQDKDICGCCGYKHMTASINSVPTQKLGRCKSALISEMHKYYWKCQGTSFVLAKCSAGQRYDPGHVLNSAPCKEESLSQAQFSGVHTTVKPTLDIIYLKDYPITGLALGTAYDEKKSVFDQSKRYWNTYTIQSNKRRTNLQSTVTKYYSAQTNLDRLAHIDISAEIKISIMGGLITISGAAEFYKKDKLSEDTVYIYLDYFSTVFAETMPTNVPGNSKYCRDEYNDKITHFVSSVTYGMKARFEFKKKVKDTESVDHVRGFLEVAVKKFPSVSVEGSADVVFDKLRENFGTDTYVSFYGTFSPVINSVQDALKAFKNMPSNLGSAPNYDKANAVSYTLTPRSFFCNKADAAINAVNSQSLKNVLKASADLELVVIKAFTLQSHDISQKYSQALRDLFTFHRQAEEYSKKFNEDAANLISKVKAREEDDFKLLELYKRYMTSQFEKTKAFTNRLIEFERVITALDTVSRYVESHGITLNDFESATDLNCLRHTYKVYLNLNILPKQGVSSWMTQYDVISKIGYFVRRFSAIASATRSVYDLNQFCFLATLNDYNPGEVVKAEHQQGYHSLRQMLPIVEKPAELVPTILDIYRITFAAVQNPRPDIHPNSMTELPIEKLYVERFEFGKKTQDKRLYARFNQPIQFPIGRDGLRKLYHFAARYVSGNPAHITTDLGEHTPLIATYATNQKPENFHLKTVSESTAELAWVAPPFAGAPSGYRVILIKTEDEAKELPVRKVDITAGRNNFVLYPPFPEDVETIELELDGDSVRQGEFEDLLPATQYTAYVYALYRTIQTRANTTFESMPSKIPFYTKPAKMEQPWVNIVGQTEVTLRYNNNPVVNPRVGVSSFQLGLKKFGAASYSYTQILPAQATGTYKLYGLTPDTRYLATIEVHTSEGNSVPSDTLTFVTHPSGSVMDSLERQVSNDVQATCGNYYQQALKQKFSADVGKAADCAGSVVTTVYDYLNSNRIRQLQNEIKTKTDRLPSSSDLNAATFNRAISSPIELRESGHPSCSYKMQKTSDGRPTAGLVYIQGRPLCYNSKLTSKTLQVLCKELGSNGRNPTKIEASLQCFDGRQDFCYDSGNGLECSQNTNYYYDCSGDYLGSGTVTKCKKGVYLRCN